MSNNASDRPQTWLHWIRKHADTGVVITVLMVIGSFISGKFEKIDQKFEKMNERFSGLEKDMTTIKTVLILKNIMPNELAKEEKK